MLKKNLSTVHNGMDSNLWGTQMKGCNSLFMCGWPNKTWHSLSALDRYTLTMVLKNSDASKYQHAVYQGFKNQVT